MKKRVWMKKVLSLALVLIMVLGMVPSAVLADEPSAQATTYGKVVDPATVNTWKNYFPTTGAITTENAGGVWTDKSVFKTVSDYTGATNETEDFSLSMKDEANNFLVALSAMASTKSIKGYSSIPTDTILVLDMSSSMYKASAIDDLALAADAAVKKLLDVNKNNRVGVVLYSAPGKTEVLLPLASYKLPNGVVNFLEPTDEDQTRGIRVPKEVLNYTKDKVSNYNTGTFTQDGVYVAMKQLLDEKDKTVTSGIQAGEERMPIIVLMTDGAPTIYSNNFSGSNASLASLPSNSEISENSNRDFANQLTAAYAKYMLENSENGYKTYDLLFYSLGFNVTAANAPALWPQGSIETNLYWEDLYEEGGTDNAWSTTRNDLNIDLNGNTYAGFRNALNPDKNAEGYNAEDYYRSNGYNKYRYYVDQYFSASGDSLNTAFQAIVNEIILQSMYYPTFIADGSDHHHDGYLEFKDVIGDYMEVKDIKGIQLGSALFTGAALAAALSEDNLGTPENPTSAGDNVIWSVKERLGISDAQTAQDLVAAAYNAGQLHYSSDSSFSNYIGWYGKTDTTDVDSDNKKTEVVYVGFWDKDSTEVPTGAEYKIKSYGFLGQVVDGLRSTDMLYVSVQVRTHIATGKTEVIFRVPAALIPLVEYEVELEGDTLGSDLKSLTIAGDGKDAPIRLLFEVGLQDGINFLNVNDKVSSDYQHRNDDGSISFFTNHWTAEGTDHVDANAAANNTSVWFQASTENERYFYHEDTKIYQNENGALYTGDQPAAGSTLYAYRYVYESGKAQPTVEHDVIPNGSPSGSYNALQYAKQASDGSWYIPKGTPRLSESGARTHQGKNPNLTETRNGFEHPVVKHGSSKDQYHLAAILGNNGKLTMAPAQGIKLTKSTEKMDNVDLAADLEYEFTIAGADANQTYSTYLQYGGQIGDLMPVTADGNGNLTVKLKKNETIYVVGLPQRNYTVTEHVAGQDYAVSSFLVNGVAAVNGAENNVPVASDELTAVSVTNIPRIYGDVLISKTVDSDYADHLTNKFGYEMKIEIIHLDANGVYATEQISAAGATTAGPTITADAAGTASITVVLSHGEVFRIKSLPDGAQVTVTETKVIGYGLDEQGGDIIADLDKESGFTVEMTSNGTVTAQKGEDVSLQVKNSYKADSVSPINVKIDVTKNFTGREGGVWLKDTDTFKFQLLRYPHTATAPIDEVVINWANDSKSASMSLDGELYSAPGTYAYQIIEVIPEPRLPGVTYDKEVGYFDVVVEDNGFGELVITDVHTHDAGVSTIKDESTNTWNVSATFYNTYEATGSVAGSISVKKSLTNGANVPMNLGNYTFNLREVDELNNGSFTGLNISTQPVRVTLTTNAEGVANVPTRSFTEDTYYLLEEVAGNMPAMTYSNVVYGIVVDVDSEHNTTSYFKATVSVYEGTKDDDGTVTMGSLVNGYPKTAIYNNGVEITDGTAGIIPVITFEAPFTNEYKPSAATNTLEGTKILTGRDWLDTDEFIFDLYDESGNWVDGVSLKASGTSPATAPGENEDEDGGEDQQLFALFSTDETEQNPPLISSEKSFAFKPLSFDKVGTYHYTIRERVPEHNPKDGITYDTTALHVTIVVTGDTTTGNLVVSSVNIVKGEGENVQNAALSFTNAYHAEPVDVEFSAEKTLFYTNGDKLLDFSGNAFEFALYEADEKYAVTSDTPLTTVKVGATDANHIGTAVFGLTYGLSDVGDHYYVIREVIPEETNGGDYDERSFGVKVTVRDNGDGTLTGTYEYTGVEGASVPRFNNSYTAKPTSVQLEGKKTLTDEEFDGVAKSFTFDLYAVSSDYIVAEDAVPVDSATVEVTEQKKEFSFSFDGLSYTKTGTYHYVIVEKADPAQKLMQYDSTVYQVEVSVRDNGHGELVATKSVTIKDLPTTGEQSIAFHNTRMHPDDLAVNIDVTKTITGSAHTKAGFEFVLKGEDGSAIGTVVSDENGAAAFDVLAYTEEDLGKTFTYTVSETKGNERRVTYDETVYTIHVTIGLDENSKELTATITCDSSREGIVIGENSLTVPFVNQYKRPWQPFNPDPDPDVPDLPDMPTEPETPADKPEVLTPATGDDSRSGLWLAMLLVGSVGFVVTAIVALTRKRRMRG